MKREKSCKVILESALPYLEVFYQPIYNLNEKKLNVAEALLRYDDGHHQNIEQVIRKSRGKWSSMSAVLICGF